MGIFSQNNWNINGSVIMNGNVVGSNDTFTINNHNELEINGVKIPMPNNHKIVVEITGDVESIKLAQGDVSVKGNVGEAKSSQGNIDVTGNVTGNVKTDMGNINCGDVGGNAKTTMGNIKRK